MGDICLLYPQSPRHPRQKYLLTMKGLALYNEIFLQISAFSVLSARDKMCFLCENNEHKPLARRSQTIVVSLAEIAENKRTRTFSSA